MFGIDGLYGENDSGWVGEGLTETEGGGAEMKGSRISFKALTYRMTAASGWGRSQTEGLGLGAIISEATARRRWRLTDERLDAAVNVLVLLEPRGGGEGLATLRAGVSSRPHVL